MKKLLFLKILIVNLCINAQNLDTQINQNLKGVLLKHKEFVSIPNLPENKENMLKNVDWVSNEFKALNFNRT